MEGVLFPRTLVYTQPSTTQSNSPLPSAAHLNLLLHLRPVDLGAWDAPRAMPFAGDEVHENCHEYLRGTLLARGVPNLKLPYE